ncbi:unnamed protein product [Peronospora farinosa]|uniref:Uncharacterized protein n=2 Tax=Peronospora farinosa TaxID=134698 RepID=A0ABN8CGL3_9STRA|nr:unnamed protein product [Peronospora farinosa]
MRLNLLRFVVLVAALLHAVSGQTNITQSGCEICASTGNCSQAYQGSPGQFCGNWLDRQNDRRPCCCPDGSVCRLSNYACNCGYAGRTRPYIAGNRGGGLVWLWSLLGSLALLLCCCGSCFMASKKMRERRNQDNAIPVAEPVVTPIAGNQPYGTISAAYARQSYEPGYATATPAYGRYYGQSRGRGGMGAGTGAALGGTAGLLGGMMLGGALADRGNSYGDRGGYGGGGGGYDGGGGGYDGGGGGFDGGGGDFSGDF